MSWRCPARRGARPRPYGGGSKRTSAPARRSPCRPLRSRGRKISQSRWPASLKLKEPNARFLALFLFDVGPDVEHRDCPRVDGDNLGRALAFPDRRGVPRSAAPCVAVLYCEARGGPPPPSAPAARGGAFGFRRRRRTKRIRNDRQVHRGGAAV